LNKDDLSKYVPYYLTESQKNGLKQELTNFMSNQDIDYYISKYEDELLQGDGWAGLEVIDFSKLNKIPVKGIILSNSCDIDAQNARDTELRVTFAPLVKLSNYEKRFQESGLSQDRIDAKIDAIKSQSVTSIFYLPKNAELGEDHIARLDDLHSIPNSLLEKESLQSKIFTLSMVGFYLFTFKLSIHFCRLQEQVSR